MMYRTIAALSLSTLGVLALSGCTYVDRPSLFANPDPNLRGTRSEFARDAATRFPFKADAPQAEEPRARATVGYTLNRIEMVNFSDEQWEDVELWVNREYVCRIPVVETRKLKIIQFGMLYNEKGEPFPSDNRKAQVKQVEVLRNGTLYAITSHHSDY